MKCAQKVLKLENTAKTSTHTVFHFFSIILHTHSVRNQSTVLCKAVSQFIVIGEYKLVPNSFGIVVTEICSESIQ
jgi:hypothetical protein